MDSSVWLPPTVILVIGLVVGLFFSQRGGGAAIAVDPRAELLRRKEVLLGQLRDLEADQAKLEPADYAARREALLEEAASVLKALEAPEAAPAPVAPVMGSRHLVAYGMGAIVFGAVALVVLQQALKPREGAMAAVEDPCDSARLQAALERDARDIEALNRLTKCAIVTQDFQGAMQWQDRARSVDPQHPGVITHDSALRIVIGRYEEAEVGLKEAITKDPTLGEAYTWLGISRGSLGDLDGAEANLQLALQNADDAIDRQMAAQILADVRLAKNPPAPQATGTVSGDVPPGGVLFVYVRAQAEPAGMPLAAKKFESWTLPMDFTLTEADLIRGGPWPAEVWIQAKISMTGNPMVADPGDKESAVLGPLAPGATGVALTF